MHTPDAGAPGEWRVIPPGVGDTTSAFGSSIRFQLSGRETGGSLSLGLAVTPPGASPPLHVHAHDDEVFIIIAGMMSFFTPGGWKDVEPGSVIFMPRGVPHSFRNRGSEPSQHWVMTLPSGFEEFYARSAAVFARPGPPDFATIRGIAADYGYTIMGPAPE